MLRRMRAAPADSTARPHKLDWTAPFFLSVFALLATCLFAAFRKCEVALQNGRAFDRMRLTRASLRWRVGGVTHAAPSREMLLSLRAGDYAIISPPPA